MNENVKAIFHLSLARRAELPLKVRGCRRTSAGWSWALKFDAVKNIPDQKNECNITCGHVHEQGQSVHENSEKRTTVASAVSVYSFKHSESSNFQPNKIHLETKERKSLTQRCRSAGECNGAAQCRRFGPVTEMKTITAHRGLSERKEKVWEVRSCGEASLRRLTNTSWAEATVRKKETVSVYMWPQAVLCPPRFYSFSLIVTPELTDVFLQTSVRFKFISNQTRLYRKERCGHYCSLSLELSISDWGRLCTHHQARIMKSKDALLKKTWN